MTLALLELTIRLGFKRGQKFFGIDDIAALVAYSLDSCGQADHPALLGKTMDLKGAYKQFGVRLEDRERARGCDMSPYNRAVHFADGQCATI